MELIARLNGAEERIEVVRAGDRYRITVGERLYEVDARRVGESGRSLLIDGVQHEVVVKASGGRYRVSSARGVSEVELTDPLTHLAKESHGEGSAGGPETVSAYMPGRVVALLVEAGQEVQAGQGVLVLEAMKMENEIRAERSGRVGRFHVETGQAVESDDPLFELE